MLSLISNALQIGRGSKSLFTSSEGICNSILGISLPRLTVVNYGPVYRMVEVGGYRMAAAASGERINTEDSHTFEGPSAAAITAFERPSTLRLVFSASNYILCLLELEVLALRRL